MSPVADYIRAQRQALLDAEPAVRAGDVEAVHDMRVAVRRLPRRTPARRSRDISVHMRQWCGARAARGPPGVQAGPVRGRGARAPGPSRSRPARAAVQGRAGPARRGPGRDRGRGCAPRVRHPRPPRPRERVHLRPAPRTACSTPGRTVVGTGAGTGPAPRGPPAPAPLAGLNHVGTLGRLLSGTARGPDRRPGAVPGWLGRSRPPPAGRRPGRGRRRAGGPL